MKAILCNWINRSHFRVGIMISYVTKIETGTMLIIFQYFIIQQWIGLPFRRISNNCFVLIHHEFNRILVISVDITTACALRPICCSMSGMKCTFLSSLF